jgi:hypothetical protein
MTEGTRTRPDAEGPTVEGRLALLERFVDELLDGDLELRCRRLVVVQDGEEVIKLEAFVDETDAGAAVIVNSPGGGHAVATLSASPNFDSLGKAHADASIRLDAGGHQEATLDTDGLKVPRLVVVGPDGTDRIVAECSATASSVDVFAPGDVDTVAALTATTGELVDDDGKPASSAVVSVSDRAEITTSLDSGGTYRPGGQLMVSRFGGGDVILEPPAEPGLVELLDAVGTSWDAMAALQAVEVLEGRLTGLGRKLERVRGDLAEEVRTQRIVIVDQVGFERIRTTVTETASELEVLAPGPRWVLGQPRSTEPPARARLAAITGECFSDDDPTMALSGAYVTAQAADGRIDDHLAQLSADTDGKVDVSTQKAGG